MPLSPNARAALLMTLSMAAFVINDMLTKLAGLHMNMGQVMAVRGLFASIFVIALAWRQGALRHFGAVAHPMVGLRTLSDILATIAFLLALAKVPLVSVSAILQALPLAVTMGAAIFFREPVGWRRWMAITIGFVGVLVILRPGGSTFTIYSVFALACVFFCAVRDLATRAIPPGIKSIQVSVVTAIGVMLGGVVLMWPLGGWTPLTFASTWPLVIAAMLVIAGLQTLIHAMRAGDISFTAPFRYTALIWAASLGFVVFGEVPDHWTLVGAAIVIGSGIFTIYRERKRKGAKPVAAESNAKLGARGI